MADNPYVNKVIYGGQTLIDISNDTVTATHLWKNVTAHDATGAPIIGSVEPTFGELTVYPEEAVQEFDITDYTGLWGWNFVTVDAVSATYVGSGVTRRTSTDLEASGPTVTAPAGYYASSASKTVTIATLPTQTSSSSSGSQVAYVARSTSNKYINIPAGYVTAAKYYTIEGTPTATLPTQPAASGVGTSKATISRSTSDQYINIPVGFVENSAYYKVSAVADMTLPTQAISISVGTSKATIAVSTSDRYLNIPIGYNSTAQYYKISKISLTTGSATPSETAQTLTPTGYDGYSSVSVAAISSNYVGSNVARQSSANLTVSGDTVTAPAGYYESSASATVQTTSLPTATSSTYTGTKKAEITAGSSVKYLNIAEGYQTGGYYQINAAGTIPEAVLPTQTSSTSSGTKKATISRNTSTRYLNIPTGQISAAAYYEIEGVSDAVLPTATSSTSSGSLKATITRSTSDQYLNIPTGYVSSAVYYKFSAIPDCTLPTSTSVSASGTLVATIEPSISNQLLVIPQGYVASQSYYRLLGMPTMTLPTQASSTSSGTSKATIGRSTSDQYINIPTGYQTAAVYYKISAVANGSATTPATTISATPSISISATGLITATVSRSQSITPTVSAGYVSTGTAGTVTVSGSDTYQMTRLTATAYNVSTSDQTIAAGQYITGQQRFKGVVVSSTLTAANIKSGVTITVGDADNASRITSVTGTYSGGSGPALTLISTTSLGTLSTSSTSAADTSKTLSLASSTNFTNYDLLIVDISVNSTTNGRHTSSVSFIFLTGTSDVNTKNTYAVGSNVWNSKLSSSGVASTRQGTTKYGIYANSATVSSNTMTIPLYYRYNSNATGTINGSYTARVYGASLIDLIGG